MKRQKAQLSDLIQNNIYYHAFSRVKDKNGCFGWRYVLDNALSDEQKNNLLKYKNVVFGNCYYKYNPQLKYNTVIVFDKCIKGACNG